MSGLFGGGNAISSVDQQIAGMQIQTSAYGICIPLVYGRTRIPANLMYYSDFTAIPHTTTQTTGKGGGGSTQSNTSYTYVAAVALGICEGPISKLGRWWRDKEDHADITEGANWTELMGESSQSPWGYLTTNHPDEALGYGSTCYVADYLMDLGASGATKNHSFEVWGLYSHPSYGGANPRDIVQDFLGNAVHGVGFTRIHTASFTTYAQACLAAGCRLSPAFTDQKSAADQLESIMKATNSNFVWSGCLLKIIPYFDSPISSSEGSYTPNTTPVYDLGPDDFIVSGSDDPITLERTSLADAFNRVQVEFLNAGNSYNIEIAEASDQANIEQYGLRTADPIQLHMITSTALARTVAQWLLQRSLYIRNTYHFTLGPRHMLLEAMDLVTLTDSHLGLNYTPVRIIETEEDKDLQISVTAEEWPFGAATATQYPSNTGEGGGTNWQADPGNAWTPVVFEPPPDMTNGIQEAWLGTCGGPNWGGCDVLVSRDGSTYSKVATVTAPARLGFIYGTIGSSATASYDAQGADITNTIYAQLPYSGSFTSASSADAAKFENPCYVGGEVMSFQNALMITPTRHALTVLRRGLYGSTSVGHSAGSKFMRLDDALAKIPCDRWNVGETMYIKLVSFNKFGLSKQDPAEVPVATYIITGQVFKFVPPNAVISFALSYEQPI